MATEYAAPFTGSPITSSLQFRRRNRPASPDGIDADFGSTAGAVSASGGTSVDIQNMRAIVQGALYELTAGPLNLAVAANGGGSNRYDIAVLTYDDTHTPGVYSRIIQGTAGAGLPALTNNLDGVWDVPLAHWEKTPAGVITNLVDRRFFLDGSGGIIGKDQGGTQYFPPAPRRGQRVSLATSAGLLTREYRWSGSFWERIDSAPLLEASSQDGGDVTSTSWTGTLVGAGALSDTFVAPTSGRVKVSIGAMIGNGDKRVFGRCRITGPGVTHEPADDSDKVLSADLTGHATNWLAYTLSGFTPGSTYTAALQFHRESGSSSNVTFVDQRRIMIERA